MLPERFRDDIPQPLAQCPPSSANLLNALVNIRPAHEQVSRRSAAVTQTLRYFRSPLNAFRLLRQYFSTSPPSHDPEELVDFSDLCDGHGESSVFDCRPDISATVELPPDILLSEASFGPYPNQSSFLLGEWYWNGGRQKSHEDFRSLLNIIGSADFRPEDVQNTKWRAIDTKLGMNDFDGDDDGTNEWFDDAGWRKSAITISVPFHKQAKHPGAKDFLVGFFYHRSLTEVIKEKLSNSDDNRFFHYEPFELLWKRHCSGEEVRVHGELYTSPAFQEVHQELQASQNEPGCDLQKVVIALMFLSNATQLTQFGTASLWPAYLMFGNESKYRGCKPTCNSCHHVAYFHGVSFKLECVLEAILTKSLSSLTALKIFFENTWDEGLGSR